MRQVSRLHDIFRELLEVPRHEAGRARVEGVMIVEHLLRSRLLDQLEHHALLRIADSHRKEILIRKMAGVEEAVAQRLPAEVNYGG